MIGAGEVVGPLLAALLLTGRCPLSVPFVLAQAGCFAFLAFTLVALRETRPSQPARCRTSADLTTDDAQALGSAVPANIAHERTPFRVDVTSARSERAPRCRTMYSHSPSTPPGTLTRAGYLGRGYGRPSQPARLPSLPRFLHRAFTIPGYALSVRDDAPGGGLGR